MPPESDYCMSTISIVNLASLSPEIVLQGDSFPILGYKPGLGLFTIPIGSSNIPCVHVYMPVCVFVCVCMCVYVHACILSILLFSECHNIQNDSLKCADSEYQVERKTGEISYD